jgi:glyoxylase-like metal-dependent hydrolase (beta-lactamase superfamily II)
VTTISDGVRVATGPYPIFGQNQSPSTVANLLEKNFLPTDRFANGFTPTLVNMGTELVLFDTGLGEGGRDAGMGRLRERLQASGYRPEDVSIVVLTHFHGDHIGGMTEGEEPAFPNARYVVPKTEYAFWTDPARMKGPAEGAAKLVARKVKPFEDKTTFIEDGETVTAGIVAIAAPGHTPGHMIYRLVSNRRLLTITGDVANHYVVSLQRPDWHVQYDFDKEQATATRRKVFDVIAERRMPFIGYHMPFPAVGYVEKFEQGYRYMPATYQFEV